MKLSQRLTYLASETKGYKTLVDVGCDHGYLGIEAVKTYGVEEVLLTDINEEPLNRAKENVKRALVEDKVSCLLGDGLKPLKKDYEVINISGIGGGLMVKILTEGLERLKKAKKIILGANSEVPLVRKFLMDNNFKIVKEEMIHENKYYEIIIAIPTKGEVTYNRLELLYGPILLKEKSKAFIDCYKKQLDLFRRQLPNIDKENKSFLKIKLKIKELEEVTFSL